VASHEMGMPTSHPPTKPTACSSSIGPATQFRSATSAQPRPGDRSGQEGSGPTGRSSKHSFGGSCRAFFGRGAPNGASEGLEYLAELPQRHPTDSREIAFAAWKISRDREVVQKRGGSQPLLSALQAYGDDGEAYKRWQTYNGLKPIFS